ncbi:MAG: carboxynorspermidine decarboxylase, partial [Pseudomonadales bacterium]|nr:carboxynorspermidine decarboxylase [Pseudomonadales bacterium]
MQLQTPYYLVDESLMLPALERIRYVETQSGAKSVLALKCFSTWCVFDFMKNYMAGTTSSSLYEARLGHEKFGGENHGYSVAYTEAELKEVVQYCDKVIFNSLSQLDRFYQHARHRSVGLRINPEVGCSHYALSDTVGRYSRLGVRAELLPAQIDKLIDGAMFHMNCENDDVENISAQIDQIESRFAALLPKLSWVSLGGGIAFTSPDYPVDVLCQRLAEFAARFDVQVYLEPGDAAVKNSAELVVSVLDLIENEVPTLIVDAGVETHALDLLVYQFMPKLKAARAVSDAELDELVRQKKPVYRVCGRTCLAGDVFGNYVFEAPVQIGQQLHFQDMAGYTMVKKNYFNGIQMPSIVHKNLQGETRIVQSCS